MSNTLTISPVPAAAPIQPQGAAAAAPAVHSGFTFHDFINIINPLQHIPVVGTIYRELTGDTMKPISTILGGALFGGIVGLATSAVDAIVQEATGEDIGAHIMATLGLHHDHDAARTASAGPSSGPSSGKTVPVPAFLVAEAQADHAARGGSAPVGTLQPTQFWQSLQHGGTGITHGSAGRPVITIGPARGGSTSSAAPGAVPQGANGPVSLLQPTLQPASAASASIVATPSAGTAQSQAAIQLRSAQAQAASSAPGTIQTLPRDQIPEKMMQALAKYEAMHKQSQAQLVDQVN